MSSLQPVSPLDRVSSKAVSVPSPMRQDGVSPAESSWGAMAVLASDDRISELRIGSGGLAAISGKGAFSKERCEEVLRDELPGVLVDGSDSAARAELKILQREAASFVILRTAACCPRELARALDRSFELDLDSPVASSPSFEELTFSYHGAARD